MLLGQLRFWLLVTALLGGLADSARAQEAPAASPTGGATTASPAERSTVPAPPPAADSPSSIAPAPSVATPPPGDPAPRAAPPVGDPDSVKIADAAVVTRCRYLGQDSRPSTIPDDRGHAQIRLQLRKAAAERGASHILFFDHQGSSAQREIARFYSCAETGSVGELTSTEGDSSPASPRASYGVLFELVPAGLLDANINGKSMKLTTTAYGIGLNLDYFVWPNLAIGAAPRFAYAPQEGGQGIPSASEFDLLARVSVGASPGDGLLVRAYGTVGGSWIFVSDVTPSGVAYGVGVMASYAFHSNYFSLDIGYQFGEQTVSIQSNDVAASSNFLHIGIGGGAYFW